MIQKEITEGKRKSLSEHIEALPKKINQKNVNLETIIDHLGRNSLLFTIFVITIPNLLPFVNAIGITSITGIALLFLTTQLMLGQKRPWLPKAIKQRTVTKSALNSLSKKAAPYIGLLEASSHSRMQQVIRKELIPFYGAFLFVLTFIMLLPLPFVNVMPAICMVVILLGLLQNDGLMALIGVVLSSTLIVGLICIAFYFHDVIDAWYSPTFQKVVIY